MRDLWHVAAEVQLPKVSFMKTTNDVVASITRVTGLTDADVLVDIACINCGKGRRNPMKHVRILHGGAPLLLPCTLTLALEADLRPTSFQKRILRVFAYTAAHANAVRDTLLCWFAALTPSP